MDETEQAAIARARQLLQESINYRTTVISEIHKEIMIDAHDGWSENNARQHLGRHIHLVRHHVHIP